MTNLSLSNKLVSKRVYAIIKHYEGLSLYVYEDKGDGGTVGYGHLLTAKEAMRHALRVNGKYVKFTRQINPEIGDFSDFITLEQAEQKLIEDVEYCSKQLSTLLTRHKVPTLLNHQFDALLIYFYNIGTRQFIESTLLKKLIISDFSAVPVQLKRWIYDDGVVMKGLVKRRKTEAELFSTGKYSLY